jgi:hypothetical protein
MMLASSEVSRGGGGGDEVKNRYTLALARY